MDDVEARRAELADFRAMMRAELAEFRETMRADSAELRQEVTAKIAGIEKELAAVKSEVKIAVRDARNEVIKWSFFFWIVTLGSLFLGRMLP